MEEVKRMAPASRVPRSASQAATRERLIATALTLIAKESIPAMSLRQLCSAAGFTQGAFYSNFEDKDALVIEAIRRHLANRHRQLAELEASLMGVGAEETFGALSSWLRDLNDKKEWATLAAEFRLHAQRDLVFGDKLRSAEAGALAGFADIIGDLAERLGSRPALPPFVLAQMLFDVWHASVLRASSDDEQPETVFVATLRRMLLPGP